MSPPDTVPELRESILAGIKNAVAKRGPVQDAFGEYSNGATRKELLDLHERLWKEIDKLRALSVSDAIEMATEAVQAQTFCPSSTLVLAKLHPAVRESAVLRDMKKSEARIRLQEQLARPRQELVDDLREHPHRMHRMLDDMLLIMGLARR